MPMGGVRPAVPSLYEQGRWCKHGRCIPGRISGLESRKVRSTVSGKSRYVWSTCGSVLRRARISGFTLRRLDTIFCPRCWSFSLCIGPNAFWRPGSWFQVRLHILWLALVTVLNCFARSLRCELLRHYVQRWSKNKPRWRRKLGFRGGQVKSAKALGTDFACGAVRPHPMQRALVGQVSKWLVHLWAFKAASVRSASFFPWDLFSMAT